MIWKNAIGQHGGRLATGRKHDCKLLCNTENMRQKYAKQKYP